MSFQGVDQRRAPDRRKHVWTKLSNGRGWKCVLCGGVATRPDDDAEIRRYEKLTDEERTLCPKNDFRAEACGGT